jgi:chromosome segregation ATPase
LKHDRNELKELKLSHMNNKDENSDLKKQVEALFKKKSQMTDDLKKAEFRLKEVEKTATSDEVE